MASPYYPVYGVGILALTPSGSNPSIARGFVIKDASVSLKVETEELYGEELDPIDVAQKSRKCTIKAKCSGYAADYYAALMSLTATTGSKIVIPDEAGTIPDTPFKITVTNGATFAYDLGVIDTTSGLAMTRGASADAANKYAVNTTTGEYTFNTGDKTHNVLISYAYTGSAVGKTVTVASALAGAATVFSLDLYRTYKSNCTGIRFPAVVGGGFDIAFGSQKHAETDLEFTAYKDSTTGNLAVMCFAK